MSKQQQEELFKPDFGWFHFFRDLIRSGKWSKLSGTAAKIYPVIKSYSSAENGAAFPSVDLICQESGCSRPATIKALQELVEAELLTADKGIGRKSTVYRIKEHWRTPTSDPIVQNAAVATYVPQNVQNILEGLRSGKSNQYVQIIINNNTGDVTVNQEAGNIALKQIMDMLEGKP